MVGLDALPIDIPEVPTRVVPLASDPEFLPQLRRLVSDFDVDTVVPTVSEELPILADAQETIAAHVVIGSPVAVRTADDKFLTALCLSTTGSMCRRPRWRRRLSMRGRRPLWLVSLSC